MLTVCWAAKGGSGTTVVSCALALLAASRHGDSLMVDLAGDAAAVFGLSDPTGPGIHDWVATSSAPASAAEAIAVPVTERLRLVSAGSVRAQPENPRWAALGQYLAGLDALVVVDAGTAEPPSALLDSAHQRLLVTRPCYLALRRACAGIAVPTGVIVVMEPGRALRVNDVSHAVRAPVVAEVSMDPSVARAVDAGLLAARMPRSLSGALRDLAP